MDSNAIVLQKALTSLAEKTQEKWEKKTTENNMMLLRDLFEADTFQILDLDKKHWDSDLIRYYMENVEVELVCSASENIFGTLQFDATMTRDGDIEFNITSITFDVGLFHVPSEFGMRLLDEVQSLLETVITDVQY